MSALYVPCVNRRPTSQNFYIFFIFFIFLGVLVRSVQARGMTELIPSVKIETRHPVDGSFGNEFGRAMAA